MKKIGIVGGTEAFERLLRNCCLCSKLIRFSDVRSAVQAIQTDTYEALFVLPEDGKELCPTVDYETFLSLASLCNQGQKLYVECYDAGDYDSRDLFGFINDAPMRGFYDEYIVWNGSLLQARGHKYLPGRNSRGHVLATIENCLGSHTPVQKGTYAFPLIVKNHGFIYSAIHISRFDRLTMLPHSRWRSLIAELLSSLLSEKEETVAYAFDLAYPPVGLRGEVELTQKSIEFAVKKALSWHIDSGVMPDRSGKMGMYEMIRSMDLSVRSNKRVDVIMLTAALFVTAGEYFNELEWTARGEALAEYGFKNGIQLEAGVNDGLFQWFVETGVGRNVVYASDNGRDAMALMQLCRVTGQSKYFERLLRQADMFLRWLDDDAYFKQTSFSLNEYDIASLPRGTKPANSPVFYEGVVLSLAYLFRKTGEMRYFKAVKRIADALSDDYPNYSHNYSPLTVNFLFSRLLTILIAAQETGCGDYSERINELVAFFRTLQDSSGGVADASLVDDERALTHPEFSVGMGKGFDTICDMLYCVNNLLGACSVAKDMKRPLNIDLKPIAQMQKNLLRFVLATQICDYDARLDGGWMRAYDLAGKEFFGVNRDKDWGPYCIMGGWVMSLIPLELLNQLNRNGIYSID